MKLVHFCVPVYGTTCVGTVLWPPSPPPPPSSCELSRVYLPGVLVLLIFK